MKRILKIFLVLPIFAVLSSAQIPQPNPYSKYFSLAAGGYLNFGSLAYGANGYGIRDNGGTLQYKNSGGSWANIGSGGGGGGSSTFIGLTDVPASFSGAGGYLVKVKSDASALEFVATPSWITLTSLSSSATGLTYTNTTGAFSLTANYMIPGPATLNYVLMGNGASAAPTFQALGSAAFTASTAYDAAGAAAAVTPTTLGLVIGTNTQAYNAKLTGLSNLADAAGWYHSNGSGTYAWSTPSYSDVGAEQSGAVSTHNGSASAHGFTTAGKAIANVTNPSAITFLRVNADNSATLLSASDMRTALGLDTAATHAAGDFSVAAGSSSIVTTGTVTAGTWQSYSDSLIVDYSSTTDLTSVSGACHGQSYGNTGASGTITITLPAAAAKMRFSVEVVAAYAIVLTPHTGDQFDVLTSAANKTLTSDTVSNTFIYFECRTAGHWRMKAMNGSWVSS